MERFIVLLVVKTRGMMERVKTTAGQSVLRLVRRPKRNAHAKVLMFLIDSVMVSRRILIFLDIYCGYLRSSLLYSYLQWYSTIKLEHRESSVTAL